MNSDSPARDRNSSSSEASTPPLDVPLIGRRGGVEQTAVVWPQRERGLGGDLICRPDPGPYQHLRRRGRLRRPEVILGGGRGHDDAAEHFRQALRIGDGTDNRERQAIDVNRWLRREVADSQRARGRRAEHRHRLSVAHVEAAEQLAGVSGGGSD